MSCHQLLVHQPEVHNNEDKGRRIAVQELICVPLKLKAVVAVHNEDQVQDPLPAPVKVFKCISRLGFPVRVLYQQHCDVPRP